MAREDLNATDSLADLRKESLEVVLFCLAVAAYVWYLVLFQPVNRIGPAAWGPFLLAGGATVAFLLRGRDLSLASAAAVLGLAAAILCNMWSANTAVAPYLLAAVVSLTGLLFGMRAVAWVTVLCCVSVFVIQCLRWGHSPLSFEVLSSGLVIGTVGILSSLTVRNLYQTLHWALSQTMEVQRNQEELRNQRGELARTLKALDEACRRLQYLNYDLAWAREEAEKARLAKQQFAANVSHELRTPLNVIMAFSETMYLSPDSYGGIPLPPEYRGDVREIYRSSKHLLHLIDDVLDMARIEAGKVRIDLEPVRLQDVVTEAIEMVRPLVEGREIALRTELPANLPPVLIDRARVQQVLLNLLNNARRFTEHGSIGVQVTLDGKWVKVTVTDTGKGIPPSEQANLFKEFHQLEVSSGQRHDGSGLGLAISKRFIEMHGGRIWVESDGIPGRGSRFHFTLPAAGVRAPEVTARRSTAIPVRPPAGRGRVLLVLGEDYTLTRMLERELEEYQVVLVGDVSEVPRLINELHARAVLLNSVQARQAWRKARRLGQEIADLPVPLVIAPLLTEHRLGRSLGAVEYLVKPVTREALTLLLSQVGEDVHQILVVDDDPRMARILSRLIRAIGRECRVTNASDGQEGLRKMRQQRPDLVLLDLIMPDMDGYQVLAQMHEDASLRDIPVVLITGQTRTPEAERRVGGGMICVCNAAGFTNAEVLTYLRSILGAVGVPSPLMRVRQTVQDGQKVGLGDRL